MGGGGRREKERLRLRETDRLKEKERERFRETDRLRGRDRQETEREQVELQAPNPTSGLSPRLGGQRGGRRSREPAVPPPPARSTGADKGHQLRAAGGDRAFVLRDICPMSPPASW